MNKDIFLNWYYYIDQAIKNIINLLNPSWPQATIIAVILIIYFFKNDIASLMTRIKEISKDKLLFEQLNNDAIPPSSVSETKDKLEKISQEHIFTTVTESVVVITESVEKMHQDEKVASLTKGLAETYFYLRCQSVYNLIFGTQIIFLKRLNTVKPSGVNKNWVIEYFHNNVSAKFPDCFSNWTYEVYLNFLQQSFLITQNQEKYHITNFGVDFLVWLQKAGLSEDKYL